MARIFSFFLVLLSGIALAQNDVVTDAESSEYNLNKPERVEWFRNTGSGLFIHFSMDSQLGIVISHALVGASKDFEDRYFNELYKTFNPYRFDPEELVTLAKLAGMKYIVFTTKHHSGFCMWDTKTTEFKITNTRYQKDILREYVDATRAAGLGVGFYFSPEDFWFLKQHNIPIDRPVQPLSPELAKAYDDYTRQQCEELMTNYGKIDVLFIDGDPKAVVKETSWRLQPDILITRGAMKTPEQVLPGAQIDEPWLSCITMGTAWQYQPTNERYKSGGQLLQLLIEARAKGGSLLLNVGPKPNGELPIEQENRLREMAAWDFINHESMDSVRSWVVSHEQDIWFTSKDNRNTLYAIVTNAQDWREGTRKSFTLQSVKATPNTRVSVLGQNSRIIEYRDDDISCRYTQTAEGLEVSVVKAQRIYDDHRWPNPVVIKLEHIEPTIARAVKVETLGSEPAQAGVTLHGVIHDYDGKVQKAYFYVRPFAGQVETLYVSPWKKTAEATVDKSGNFSVTSSELQPGQRYEYKAVAIQSGLSVEADSKVYQRRQR
ncbi:alpha-L-fucosidase [Parapedobacter lycopersici]|uniref:alpha-L-fucosidase n=1 Tax=Parapedobacter lycopersici TaxID=1864939 RepID=UPI00333ED484